MSLPVRFSLLHIPYTTVHFVLSRRHLSGLSGFAFQDL